MIETREVEPSEYGEVAAMMRELGLGCSREYLERRLPHGVVALKDGELVGFCGYIPVKIWVGDEERGAMQLGMLGMRPGNGTAIKKLIDSVLSRAGNGFIYANSTNAAGHRAWMKIGGFAEGPEFCARIQWTFSSPIGILARPRLKPIDPKSVAWRDFAARLKASNRGVMTARDPERWRELFGEALTIEHDGAIVGMAAIKRTMYRGILPRCEIMDIVAVGNDREVISKLVAKARRYAASVGSPILEFVGPPLLPHSRAAVANLFVYKENGTGIKTEDLARGWFFGPLDGDRVLEIEN